MQQGRKVILFVDNVSSHKVHVPLTAIEIAYLPPNTTSLIQPCDQGIIRSFKTHYRTKLLRRLLLWFESNRGSKKFEISLLDAVNLSLQAWAMVDSNTIANCFKHSGFCHPGTSHLNASVPPFELEEESRNIFDILAQELQLDASFEQYLQVDDDVVTEEFMQDEVIVQQVKNQMTAKYDF